MEKAVGKLRSVEGMAGRERREEQGEQRERRETDEWREHRQQLGKMMELRRAMAKGSSAGVYVKCWQSRKVDNKQKRK